MSNQNNEKCFFMYKKKLICPIKSHKGAWVLCQNYLQLAASPLCKLLHRHSRRKDYNLSTVFLLEKWKTSEILHWDISLSMKKLKRAGKTTVDGGKSKEDVSLYLYLFIGTNISLICFCLSLYSNQEFHSLYYYIRNFCNLIGLEKWYFSLIWNTYMWTFCM